MVNLNLDMTQFSDWINPPTPPQPPPPQKKNQKKTPVITRLY